jgi:hypothetical protein
MRIFFGIDSTLRTKDSTLGSVTVDELSCISSSSISSGTITNCVLSNVRCNNIDAIGSILINVTANSIYARDGSVIYNIADNTSEGINITEGKVLAGVFSKDGSHMVVNSSISTDGGKNCFYSSLTLALTHSPCCLIFHFISLGTSQPSIRLTLPLP